MLYGKFQLSEFHHHRWKIEVPDYEELNRLSDIGKARITETALDGACQLWDVEGHEQLYVVLADNTVITQAEDNSAGSEEAIFPF